MCMEIFDKGYQIFFVRWLDIKIRRAADFHPGVLCHRHIDIDVPAKKFLYVG
jgi:hypothetical protein